MGKVIEFGTRKETGIDLEGIKAQNIPQKDTRPNKAETEEETLIIEKTLGISQFTLEFREALRDIEKFEKENIVGFRTHKRLQEIYIQMLPHEYENAKLSTDKAMNANPKEPSTYLEFCEYCVLKYEFSDREEKKCLDDAVYYTKRMLKNCGSNPEVYIPAYNVLVEKYGIRKIDYLINHIQNGRRVALFRYRDAEKELEINGLGMKSELELELKNAEKLLSELELHLLYAFEEKDFNREYLKAEDSKERDYIIMIEIAKSLHSRGHGDENTYYSLGTLYDSLGEKDEAMHCYDKALERCGDFAAPAVCKAKILMDSGKFGEAKDCIRRVMNLNLDNEVMKEKLENDLTIIEEQQVKAYRESMIRESKKINSKK